MPGVFPIDGDCSRFLLCRQGRQGRTRQARQDRTRQARLFQRRPKIKGKVYRCPEGELLGCRRCRRVGLLVEVQGVKEVEEVQEAQDS